MKLRDAAICPSNLSETRFTGFQVSSVSAKGGNHNNTPPEQAPFLRASAFVCVPRNIHLPNSNGCVQLIRPLDRRMVGLWEESAGMLV